MVFLKKEFKEYYRSGRLFIFGICALLFGLMNPAIAKLTPKLLEAMADSMKKTGMSIEISSVDASACWEQYYKNLPMLMIIMMIVFCGSFAKEYSKGTLLLVITKGYPRKKIYAAKAALMFSAYLASSLIYFGITWFYSGYYWDNSILSDIFPAAAIYWLFGLLIISLILFFSSFLSDTGGIIGATAGIVMVLYLLSIVPKIKKYLPVKLTEAQALLTKQADIGDFSFAIVLTLLLSAGLTALGGFLFQKKTI